MTLTEFEKQYRFHDSILEKLTIAGNQVRMRCAFCDFMQENYHDGRFSNSDIVITFYRASCEIEGAFPVSGSVFLNQELNGNRIDFFMLSDNGECGTIGVEAESVEMEKLRSYNL